MKILKAEIKLEHPDYLQSLEINFNEFGYIIHFKIGDDAFTCKSYYILNNYVMYGSFNFLKAYNTLTKNDYLQFNDLYDCVNYVNTLDETFFNKCVDESIDPYALFTLEFLNK